MKANFTFGKKQIILAALTVVLGAAVYLNWQFANKNAELTDAGTSSETTQEVVQTEIPTENEVQTEENTNSESNKMLGESKLVNAKVMADEDYFVTAKLTRTKARDTAIQTLQTVLNDEKLTEADKKSANEKAVSITDIIEAECRIENLIKAKGFEECMVYITGNNANVVVKTEGLNAEDATRIKNIVVTEGKIKGENVAITEIK